MSFFSFLDEEQDFFLSLKWAPRGVLTSLACFILNLSRTYSIYFSCDNHSFLAFLSCRICIPKIYLVGPKSFISNDLNKSFFKFPITLASCPTINISSTYSKRITNLLLGNFLTYTMICICPCVPVTHHEWVKLLVPLSWSTTVLELASSHINSSLTCKPYVLSLLL